MRARYAAMLVMLAGCELFAGIPEPVTDDLVDGGGDGAPAVCASTEDCVSPLPVCEVQTGVCVECLEGADCSTAEPACVDHACVPCSTDDQCGAGVCLLDGTCAAAARILYASPGGTGAGCTSQTPCTFDTAVGKLSPTTDVIKLGAGTYVRTVTTTIMSRAFIAGTGATFDGAGGQGDAMLTDAGAELTVTGLLFNGVGMGGVACTSAGTIRLHRVTIQGVSFGMYADPCATEIRRSRFVGTSFYAMYLRNSAAVVENVDIVRNGGGQFQISAIVLENATGSLEHATVAYNVAPGPPAAINCGTSPGFAIKNSIFFQNTMDAACNVTYSIVDPGYAGGANNVKIDPMFVSAGTNDFHLAPGSPATNIGDPASTVKLDRDGEVRPQPAGSRVDVGADEIP